MRNLHINCQDVLDGLPAGDDVQSDIDSETNRAIVYSEGRLRVKHLPLDDYLTERDDEFSIELDLQKCIALLFLPDSNSCCLADESGLLLTVELFGSESVEEVGSVESGITALSRSPDDELFVLATGQGTIIVMTREFDPLIEVPLHQTSFGEHEFMDVGWGKKSTQFHGSEGKAAAVLEKSRAQPVFDWDDRKTRITWRDDGELFAVSYVTPDTQARCIRVFNREGTLQSTSEEVNGLEHSLAWKPSGSVLASTERRPNKHLVAFFEKNGLRHGDFKLPFGPNEVNVNFLGWNVDSTVLAVVCEEFGSKTNHVMLWTSGNYHWYLKQSWTFSTKVVQLLWDKSHPLKFHLLLSDGSYRGFQLSWRLDRSHGHSAGDLAAVAVTDGRTVKVTPFRQTVVPPPVSAYELHFEANVKSICFGGDSFGSLSSNSMCVVTTDNKLHIFDVSEAESDSSVKITACGGQGFRIMCDYVRPLRTLSSKTETLMNFCWLSPDVMLASSPNNELIVLHLSESSAEIRDTIPCESKIFSIAAAPDGMTAAIQLIDGTILKYDDGGCLPWQSDSQECLAFPSVCQAMEVLRGPDGRLRVIGLNDRHRLYLDGSEISNAVTSFRVHSDFLLVTTIKHKLKCLPLDCLDGINESAWPHESVRALERGSRLVTSVAAHTQTVLQMPRGNLEVIHPRALALCIVKRLIDEKKYKEVYEILRRQRINLNLIVDHNYPAFAAGIEEFISQITDINRLCLFIADLSNEDVTQTMYKSMYSAETRQSVPQDKTDSVCRAMLEVLEKNEERYLLPIVSCLVKQSTSKLDEALLRIQNFRARGDTNVADEALRFLLLLVDVNALFDVALGTYDFDLVLFVAEKSQKDPKEYLPFLNDLKRQPSADYRKYKIDLHLKKYEKALKHLAACGEERIDECLELIKAQRLYVQAMGVFPQGTALYQSVCRIYGEYLNSKRYFEDAALIFESAGLFVEAMESWEQAGNSCYCLAAAAKAGVTDLGDLCRRLVNRLKDDRRFAEAAEIQRDYLSDPEEAIATLVEGQLWSQANQLIARSNRADLIATHLEPAVRDHLQQTMNKMNDQLFDDQLRRLTVVLETRKKIAAGDFEDVEVNVEDADLYSDTTSVRTGALGSVAGRQKSNPASIMTRQSQRSKSSKNRRKHEKKKYSTKEGSEYEDLGLIASLHEIISNTFKASEEIGPLLRALVRLNQSTEARELQRIYSARVDRMKSAMDTIWSFQPTSAVDDHRFGPEATTEQIVAGTSAKTDYTPAFGLLDAGLRHPPWHLMPKEDWKLQILS